MATTNSKPRISDLCPDCKEPVIFKPVGDSLLAFDRDGTIHKCAREYQPKPIGQTIKGKIIEDFHLKQRIATLILSENYVLEISAASNSDLVAMNLRLVSPDGILEEKK